MGHSGLDGHGRGSLGYENGNHLAESWMVWYGRCLRDCGDSMLDSFAIFISHIDRAQIFLIVFAAMVNMSVSYGFGMHVVDIQRSGGSVTMALKVSTIWCLTA